MSQEPFERTALHDGPALVGAEWWQQSLATSVDAKSRRTALIGIGAVVATVLLMGKCVSAIASSGNDDEGDDDDENVGKAALTAQKEHGWSFGSENEALMFDGESTAPFDRSLLDVLATKLAPTDPSLKTFYVPTLFQSLTATPTLGAINGQSIPFLRDVVRPISTPAMEVAFARGRSIASLFDGAKAGPALVIDLPGPEAVAFAAGLAESLEPVWLFDNWPHPRGVVPSHLTLAAVAFLAPQLIAAQSKRPTKSPAAFVLDRNRLARYDDQSDRFDNRYVARMPSAESMKALGITQVLYVVPTQADRELDDLNADFAAYEQAGVPVKLIATSDFVEGQAPSQLLAGDGGVVDAQPSASSPPPATWTPRRFYYGHPTTHWIFWSHYGWGAPRYYVPSSPPPPSHLSWAPKPRPTIFGGPGIKTKPSSFSSVTVTKSKSSGGVKGGSWGRSTSTGG